MFLSGCGGESSTSQPLAAPPASKTAAESLEQELAANQTAPPELGLTPLPTVEQVREAAPGGRQDPFAPLPGAMAGSTTPAGNPEQGSATDPATDPAADPASEPAADPGSGITLTGVLLVNGQSRALASTADLSGVLCVSADGRCSGDSAALLPPGWSVLAIDVPSGCVRLAQNGTPQDPLCIS